MKRAWILVLLIEEAFGLAQRIREPQNEGGASAQCGIWTKSISGGQFMSPNYPNTYPPNKECVYVLEALPRQRIQLVFDKNYYIEPSFECRFDHLEVRDGPFGFSPLIDRFCGPRSPETVTSTGRFMWIKFISDEELEGLGFRIKYTYIADPDFKLHVGGLLNPIPDCQFELGGLDGVVRSSQVEEEQKVKPGEALDCIWTIRAPPRSKIYLRFLEYQLENSNECKRNFVAVYDGSSAIENLKAKFCSTVANDVMLGTGVGVVRMWADQSSRLSRFRIIYTSFVDPPCSGNTFFCHSNMCINNSLVCNGVQNCVYPWDENHCKEKKSRSLFQQISRTHGTVIGVSSGVVSVLLLVSILVQLKQPRKKIVARRPAGYHQTPESFEGFEPPRYELFSLRDKELSSELAELSEELEGLHKLRPSSSVSSSSRCVHEHHCGSQAPPASAKSGRGLSHGSSMELSYHNDFSKQPPPPPPPMKTFNSGAVGGVMSGVGGVSTAAGGVTTTCIPATASVKKSCYAYKQTEPTMEELPCEIYVRGGATASVGGASMGGASLSIRNHGNVSHANVSHANVSHANVSHDQGQRSISMDF